MAHVQRRIRNGEVRWVARYVAPDGRERTKTHDRKVDAERWIIDQASARRDGAWIDPRRSRQTFAGFVAAWSPNDLRARSETLARRTLQLHLVPRFGSFPLSELTTSDVNAWIAEALRSGLAPASVERYLHVLSRVLSDAVRDGRIVRNPCEEAATPRRDERPMRMLTAEQVETLVEQIHPFYAPLVATAAYCGLRWGELAGLRLERLDLLRRTIRVEETLVEDAGHLSFGPPKTKASRRAVTLPSAVAELLAVHVASAPVQESGMVFPTSTGELLRRGNFRRRAWTTARRRAFGTADLATLRFHELRHTAASLAIAAGAHPLTIKERLGHTSITVTMDRYGHLFPGVDDALADALDARLRQAREAVREATVVELRRSSNGTETGPDQAAVV